ncbi:hypothetical protein RB195_016474 [Necator americanus]
MPSRRNGQAEYLYPNKDAPTPLPEDFYKEWLNGDHSLPQTQAETDTARHQPQCDSSTTNAIVDQLIRENQDLIEKEALKQAAAAALNINAAQYSNLIPISFDQEEFIRQEEQKRNKHREKMLQSLRQNK